jgi:hypothetical protein
VLYGIDFLVVGFLNSNIHGWFKPRSTAVSAQLVLSAARMLGTSDDVAALLHERILGGDLEALGRLAEELLQPTIRGLRAEFSRVTTDMIATAAVDAILEYGDRPHRYNPSRGLPLARFLLFAARRNLLNLLRDEATRRQREGEYAEHCARMRIVFPRQSSLSRRVWDIRQFVLAVGRDDLERRAILAWLDAGATDDVIAALELSETPLPEQRREAKRFKDRMLARLRRSVAKQSPTAWPSNEAVTK